jgi:hypothetical protein
VRLIGGQREAALQAEAAFLTAAEFSRRHRQKFFRTGEMLCPGRYASPGPASNPAG